MHCFHALNGFQLRKSRLMYRRWCNYFFKFERIQLNLHCEQWTCINRSAFQHQLNIQYCDLWFYIRIYIFTEHYANDKIILIWIICHRFLKLIFFYCCRCTSTCRCGSFHLFFLSFYKNIYLYVYLLILDHCIYWTYSDQW